MTTDDLVIIASYANPIQAHILRGRLEAEDIPSLIFNEHLVNMNPMYSNLFGGVQVQVRPQDAERAREILREANE